MFIQVHASRTRGKARKDNKNYWGLVQPDLRSRKLLTVTSVVPQGVPVVICNPGPVTSLGPSIGAAREGKGGGEEGGSQLHVENVVKLKS